MRKTTKKISLHRETLRDLTGGALQHANGAAIVAATAAGATCAQHSCVNLCATAHTCITHCGCPTGISCGEIC